MVRRRIHFCALSIRVEGLRGKIIVPPSDIPGIGRFSVIADPQGAVFAIFKGAAGSSM